MDNNTFEMIDKYAKELALMEGYQRDVTKIMVNLEGRCYETVTGADLADLSEGDVAVIGEGSAENPIEYNLLVGDNQINALVISGLPYCVQAAKRGRPLTAALDDMAQIVGYQVHAVSYDEKAIDEALKKAAGCFIKGKAMTITIGRNLYEAVVALTVLEKSAEVNLKAEAIGGVKTLPKLEADIMRLIYKKKYSTQEQEVKSKEGKSKDE